MAIALFSYRFVAQVGDGDEEIQGDEVRAAVRRVLEEQLDVFRWAPWATIPVRHFGAYFHWDDEHRRLIAITRSAYEQERNSEPER